METLTKGQIMRLFTLVTEANESLKKAQKLLPKDSFVSKSIANNEKFLSYRKLFEENPDSEIPEGLKVVFVKKEKQALAVRNDWTTPKIEYLKREPLDYFQ